MKETDQPTRPNLREQLVEELLSRIETSTAPWEQPWSPGAGDSPVNAVTGKAYRGVNYWWLMLAQPDSDPRWCTFKQAKDHGWSVRKGSHGVQVEKWGVTDKSKQNEGDEPSDNRSKAQAPHMFVRYYTVFHASQIDGIPELEVSLDPLQPSVEHDPRLLDAIEKMGVKLTHDKACAYYVPSQDQIVLPSPGAFANASDYDMTLLHEMSHATGHESRLNRSINHRFGSPGYAKEELRASISSAMNARILGIAMDPGAIHEGDRDGLENEAAYIRSWINALPKVERKAELMAAISAAQKISDYVLSLTLPQQEEVTQAVEAVTASEATSGAVVDEPDGLPFRPKIHL